MNVELLIEPLSSKGTSHLLGRYCCSEFRNQAREIPNEITLRGYILRSDMRMELDALLKLRAEIASGEIFAPRLVASGPALDDLPPQFPLPVKLRAACRLGGATRNNC